MLTRARHNGFGWIQYKWKNPASEKIELKTTYFQVAQDAVVNCGVYSGDLVVSIRRLDEGPIEAQRFAAPAARLSQPKKPRATAAFRR